MPHLKLFFTTLLIAYSLNTSARHILSGAMNYECLGNGEYEITMTIYRDCFGSGADFDNPAMISVFANEEELINTFPVARDVLEEVEPIDCNGAPVQYCSQKAVYKFTTLLEDGNAPYQVVYQRCCWSDAVANIMNPGEHGITVMTTITPAALEVCNTQPEINMPLSFSACPGLEVEVPFFPFDADGDSLAFEICIPLEGGGLLGTGDFPGDPTACDGVAPDPACPPPYFPLTLADGFDLTNPFPTVDGIQIDSDIGIISFTPSTQGIFIYGLCVTEYRDGEILGFSTHNIETTSGVNISSNQNEEFMNGWEMSSSFANQELFFTSNSPSKNGQISLFDISGKLITTKKFINQTQTTISTQNLNSGIYFASLKTDGFLKTFKVMVID